MYRVIDLTRLLPGPYATLCMAGLGWEIIKVEDPVGGDYLRNFPPMRDDKNIWFEAINRGKRSVCLNLKDPQDRDKLLFLLHDADVLIESFRPGVMARLGLDPQGLCQRFPRLVVASLTGWGQTGPMAALPGHDIGFMALSGILSDALHVPNIQWGDLAAGGLAAALRVAGALLRRERTGNGCYLDIAMLDGLVALQPTRFANLAAHEPPDRLLTGGFPAYNLYRCADGGYVSVGALEPQFSTLLAEAAGDLSEASLIALFASAPRAVWLARLGAACVVPVLEVSEVMANPQVQARGLFDAAGLPHPPTGPVQGAAPFLGADTEALLSGYTPPAERA